MVSNYVSSYCSPEYYKDIFQFRKIICFAFIQSFRCSKQEAAKLMTKYTT